MLTGKCYTLHVVFMYIYIYICTNDCTILHHAAMVTPCWLSETWSFFISTVSWKRCHHGIDDVFFQARFGWRHSHGRMHNQRKVSSCVARRIRNPSCSGSNVPPSRERIVSESGRTSQNLTIQTRTKYAVGVAVRCNVRPTSYSIGPTLALLG